MKRHGRLFIENIWGCWIRKRKEKGRWFEFYNNDRYWFADPFLVEDGDKTYAFCEMMDRKRSIGYLGYGEIIENQRIRIKSFLKTECHMSYPDVFQYNNLWYMIPETSGNRTIELYKAVSFPDKWELASTLLTEIRAVDTTCFCVNDQYYLFIYEPNGNTNTLSIAKIDLESGTIDRRETVMVYKSKIGRPAGKVIYFHGKMYRPTQYGVAFYGEKIVFKEFEFDPDTFQYSEHDVADLTSQEIAITNRKAIHGTHTYNASSKYEVVDAYFERLYITRPIMLLLKKLKIGGYRYSE